MVLFHLHKREKIVATIQRRKKPKPSEKMPKENVLVWTDSPMSYACLPSSSATATSGPMVLPLWCGSIFPLSAVLWAINWGLGLLREVPCVCTLVSQKLGWLEQRVGGFCRKSDQLESARSVLVWVCLWLRNVGRSSFIPKLVCCYGACHLLVVSQLCHWASSGYTLLCIRFHLYSFVRYSAVSVQCLRQRDPSYSRGLLGFGARRRGLCRYLSDLQTSGIC